MVGYTSSMEQVNPKELNARLHDNDHDEILIDVREPVEYKDGRIPEAENMPLEDLADHVAELRKYATVYVTCGSGVRSKKACEVLEARGLKHIVNVSGGFTAWRRAGFKTLGSGARIPIIQQVMLTAGGLIVLAFILALLVHPYFILMALIVGMGLVFAGATGICFMAWVLGKMPWNA